MTFSSPDLNELDRIWPLGQQLVVPDGGVIFVAGAWRGRYCRYLSERFPNAKIYGFEPQRDAYRIALDKISDPLGQYLNVEIFPFGIGTQGSVTPMGDGNTDGCSVFKKSGTMVNGLFESSHAIRAWLGVERVALAVLNMEGFEYRLLNDWLNHGQIHFYDALAVQFHPELAGERKDVENDRIVMGLHGHYGYPKYADWPHWVYWRK